MKDFFEHISRISFEGKNTSNPLAYRYYNPKQVVLGKTMEEHLRIAVCFWHVFCTSRHDVACEHPFERPWHHHQSNALSRAETRVKVAFEFIEKLGIRFFTFHDRDIAPEGSSLAETQKNLFYIADKIAHEMERTNTKLLWGTANLFTNPCYSTGAATNPNPDIFCYTVTQVKQALDITHQLQGENYVLSGGCEGYDTLLNTNVKQEIDQLARFFSLLVDYKYKIGYKGTLLIEPKPCERTQHQYDFNTATVFAFLQKYGLEKEFKVNIEANLASLASHTFPHEVAYAIANSMFGSVDANQDYPQPGRNADQFPTHLSEIAQVLYLILKSGGFTTGGFNFDTKPRRQSIDLTDMFHEHISGIDTIAHGLLIAANLVETNELENVIHQRYAAWQSTIGKAILSGQMDFEKISMHVLKHDHLQLEKML